MTADPNSAVERSAALDRFVLPVSESSPVDRHGFLEPDGGVWWRRSTPPMPIFDLANVAGSFVLLAPGGAGKTTVLAALREQEGGTTADLRLRDLGEMGRALAEAWTFDRPVYLDALDEAALHQPGVYRVLEQTLLDPNARAVPWRFACRPAAWNPVLAQALGVSLPGFQQFRLLPLTRAAVARLAADEGADPDAFIEALLRSGLGRLAASPMQLLAAVRRWASTGQLETSQLDAIRWEVSQLLAETDGLRPAGRLTADRRERVAMRLAAFAVFSGAARYSTDSQSPGGAASVDSLPSDPDPDHPGTVIGPDEYLEVLGMPLFEAAPGPTVAFRHQRYAEYLAAAYLVTRAVDNRRVYPLLGVRGTRLPGAMAGVAGWLAALRPDVLGDLIERNADQLARAQVELPSDEVRGNVVGALLQQAAAGELDPDWGLDFSLLAHPALEQQLRDRLEAGLQQPAELWWCARLAAAGGCTSLVPALMDHAMSSRWEDWARGAAAHAVQVLGDGSDLARLRPLLVLDRAEDPGDELLADAVEILYPTVLTTDELFDVLRPRRQTNLVGGYLLLLGDLAERIPLEDLPAALRKAGRLTGENDDAFGRFLPELLGRAWEAAEDPAVLEALAQFLAAAATSRDHGGLRQERFPWAGGDAERRRALAVRVACNLDQDPGWYYLFDLRLVDASDVWWLLDDLPTLRDEAKPILAECLPPIAGQPDAAIADRILTLPENHPAYEATVPLRGAVELDPDRAGRRRLPRPPPSEEDDDQGGGTLRAQLVSALMASEQDPAEWWKFLYLLSQGGGPGANDHVFAHDLTGRPGWSLLTAAEQQRALEIGETFLTAHSPEPEAWAGTGTVGNRELRDWAGVYLLTTLTRHAPERVRNLDPALWVRWAPAIVTAWNFEREEAEASLRAELIGLAPTSGRLALQEAALNELDALQDHEGRLLSAAEPFEALISELAPTLAERLVAGRYTGHLSVDVLNLLIESASRELAVDVCQHLRGSSPQALSAVALRGLATLEPQRAVNDLLQSDPSNDDIIGTVPHVDFDTLSDESLEGLAGLVLERFPYDEDPPLSSGFGSDPAFETRTARSRILECLAGRGGDQALQRLADGRDDPDRDILQRLARRARATAVDLAYDPPTPKGLLKLLGRADVRLVRDGGDLLTVLTEHLQDIQNELRGRGAHRDVWAGDRPLSEDDISDWLSRQLGSRLTGSVVDREVQVTRPGAGGIGTRIDLTATTLTATQPAGAARVLVEAKLVNNSTLLTALSDQLVGRYLVPFGIRHGIYLVYWVAPDQRPDSWPPSLPEAVDELLAVLTAQAAERPDVEVRAFVLDISHP